MATIRKVVVNLTAGTAELFEGIEKSNAKIGQFGNNVRNAHGQVVSSTMAASGAIRLLEGNFTNNIRAVEKFVAVTLGLGPALQAAFGVVGGLATAGIFVKMGEEAYKFFKEMQAAPEKVARAFREMNEPIRASNDAMQVAIDKVQNEIDKLQGKHPNNLKLALDEARDSADKLTDSLDKNLHKLYDLLSQQELGAFKAFFTGQASTTHLKKDLGGFAGSGAEIGEVEKILDSYREKLDAVSTIEEKNTLRKKAQLELAKQFSTMDEKRVTDLKKAREIPLVPKTEKGQLSGSAITGGTTGTDAGMLIEQLENERRSIKRAAASVPLQFQLEDVTAKKEGLQADKAFEKPANVINERLTLMRDKLDELKVRFAEIGETDSWKAQIEGITEAHKALDELAKPLALRLGKKLDPNDPNASGKFLDSIVAGTSNRVAGISMEQTATKVETEYHAKLFATNLAIKERIANLYQLGNAMNKGYEATRNAGVEIELRGKFQNRYNSTEASDQSDIEKARQGLRQAADKEHGNQTLSATTSLGKQIELEKTLLKVQEQGAEVIAAVTLAYRLRDLAEHGASTLELQQETTKFETEQARLTKAELTIIEDKIAATKVLNDTAAAGIEAQRRAGLEEKYRQMTAHGKDDSVPLEKIKDEVDHQLKITEEAAKTANVYREQLVLVNQQIAATQKLRGTAADQLGVEISLKNLEDQRLTIAANQALAMRRAQDGVRAFFLEMQRQGESTAKIIYDALNSSVDKLSDNLAKLMTGQKTAWKDMFKSIGTDVLKAELKKDISKGLGDFGKKALGISEGELKGQTSATAIWVRNASGVGGYSIPGVGPMSGPPPANPSGGGGGGLFGSGSMGGGIFSLLKKNSGEGNIFSRLSDIFHGSIGAPTWDPSGAGDLAKLGKPLVDPTDLGYFANGGDIPSGSYGTVGEAGPEKVFGPAHVMSNKDSFGNGGGDVHYHAHVDARGSELGVENRIDAKLRQYHASAIAGAVKATADQIKRSPRRSN